MFSRKRLQNPAPKKPTKVVKTQTATATMRVHAPVTKYASAVKKAAVAPVKFAPTTKKAPAKPSKKMKWLKGQKIKE